MRLPSHKEPAVTSALLFLSVLLGDADAPKVKMSIQIVPAKPVADGRTLFQVVATVTDDAGRPVADVPVSFRAEGYGQAPDGKIVGRYADMQRDVDYRVLPAGGYWTGLPKSGVSNAFAGRTGRDGIVRANYKPPEWADHMSTIATRVSACAQIDDRNGLAASTDLWFTRPKK
jgi:hypothetical protein